MADARTPSVRYTTSSRHPGPAEPRTVWVATRKLIVCPDCGGFRLDLGGVHSPQLVREGVARDCTGREVSWP